MTWDSTPRPEAPSTGGARRVRIPRRGDSPALAVTAFTLVTIGWTIALVVTIFAVFTTGFILVFGAPPDVTGPWFQSCARFGALVTAFPMGVGTVLTVIALVRQTRKPGNAQSGLPPLIATGVGILVMALVYLVTIGVWGP